MSTHLVSIVELTEASFVPHQKANNLVIIKVPGTSWQVVSRKGTYEPGTRAVYIPPDYMVPMTNPEFAFLLGNHTLEEKPRHRMRAIKLRGEVSFGMLIPLPEIMVDRPTGFNVMEELGITRYEPKVDRTRKGSANDGMELPMHMRPSLGYIGKFELESLANNPNVLVSGENVIVCEKLHGCVTPGTRVTMADGSKKAIRDIVVGDSVLGVDNSGKVVVTEVTNIFRNGGTKKWLRIKGSSAPRGNGSATFSITCTPNHQFYSPLTKTYIAAESLSTGSEVSILRYGRGLTQLQEQILLGKILGDGSLRIHAQTAHVDFSHAQKDVEYFNWTIKGLGELIQAEPTTAISGYGTSMLRARTVSRTEIREIYGQFIKNDEGLIEIPDWVADKITPISLAFWYMDDGSLSHSDEQEDRAMFAVCAFSERSVDILLRGLSKLGIEGIKHKTGKYWRIRLNKEFADKLFLIVAPYVPASMQRKLPARYRGHSGWLPSSDNQTYSRIVTTTIDSIDLIEDKNYTTKCDIETGTHNFFVGGILVHNSNARYLYQDGTFHIGSRNRWLRTVAATTTAKSIVPWWKRLFGVKPIEMTLTGLTPNHMWLRAAKENPSIEAWCRANPNHILWGEIYGDGVQSLKYGLTNGAIKFAAFAAADVSTGKYLTHYQIGDAGDIDMVPVVYAGPWHPASVLSLAEDNTVMGGGHMREGLVITPNPERVDQRGNRVSLKHISTRYWTSNEE